MKNNLCWLAVSSAILLTVIYLRIRMRKGRTRTPICDSVHRDDNAEIFCMDLISGFKKKAASNKRESMIWFFITMVGSLVAPLFVSLGGESFVFGKCVPSLLSAVVAFGAAWMQLRKPQHLWALYRGCQRRLEDNLTKYKFRIGDYNSEYAEKILAERCADIAISAHNEWLPIMPKGDNYSSSSSADK